MPEGQAPKDRSKSALGLLDSGQEAQARLPSPPRAKAPGHHARAQAPSRSCPVDAGTAAGPVRAARALRVRPGVGVLLHPLPAARRDGRVTIELRNNGEDPHSLVVSPEGTHDPLLTFPDHEPAGVSVSKATLARGRYYLWCAIEDHEAAGMHARLRVE